MTLKKFKFSLFCLFAFLSLGSVEAARCVRPIEYQLLNLVNSVKLGEDYKSLVELGGKGSELNANTVDTNVLILARDINHSTFNQAGEEVCDSPPSSDVQDLMNFLSSKGVRIGVFDIRAMLELTLDYEMDSRLKDKRYTNFHQKFFLIKHFFTQEKIEATNYFSARKIYAKKYLKYIQDLYEYRSNVIDSLNPNIIVWNHFEKLKRQYQNNRKASNREEDFSNIMFTFMRQLKQESSGKLDAHNLVFVNPEIIDFARLKAYQDYYKINNIQLRQELIVVAQKNESLFLGENVNELIRFRKK